MNKNQIIFLWCVIVILVLMLLLPPWKLVNAPTKSEILIGYDFLLAPPKPRANMYPQINFSRLGLQIAIVAIVAGGIWVTIKTRPTKDEHP